ncbi:hypothetical protein ZIOFF_021528 [Zingiber officinale]|uniref:dUTP diphosphatase n=1 Tax=Zingiber officinale TaxID=94328 RepID=A0A8J5H0E5_ZINOF|nr:hypothetical protein ZIOFF_021528 [Zingiber officinale]
MASRDREEGVGDSVVGIIVRVEIEAEYPTDDERKGVGRRGSEDPRRHIGNFRHRWSLLWICDTRTARGEANSNGEIVAVLIERENGVFEEIDIPTNPDTEETDYPYLLVHKLSSNAIIPIRQSTGATGLDLTTSEDCVIPPRGRGLIPTGISLEIPWGIYGKIAARSSTAYRLDLDIGAGVIDCDYKGEVKILAFNHSNQIIRIYKGECVSQIIIEYIAITDVYEVQSLTLTDRGTKVFGSTSTPPIFKKLLPKESVAVLLQVENELPKPTLEQDHAGETSPRATVLQPIDTTLEYADGEDDFLEHIQYLASISTPWDLQPKWDSYDSDNPSINPFAIEAQFEELLLEKDLRAEFQAIEEEEEEVAHMLLETTTSKVIATAPSPSKRKSGAQQQSWLLVARSGSTLWLTANPEKEIVFSDGRQRDGRLPSLGQKKGESA